MINVITPHFEYRIRKVFVGADGKSDCEVQRKYKDGWGLVENRREYILNNAYDGSQRNRMVKYIATRNSLTNNQVRWKIGRASCRERVLRLV